MRPSSEGWNPQLYYFITWDMKVFVLPMVDRSGSCATFLSIMLSYGDYYTPVVYNIDFKKRTCMELCIYHFFIDFWFAIV